MNLLLDTQEGYPPDLNKGRTGYVETVLKEIARANVDEATTAWTARRNELAKELCDEPPYCDHLSRFKGNYRATLNRLPTAQLKEQFKAQVKRMTGVEESRKEQAEKQRTELNDVLRDFRTAYISLAMHDVEAMKKRSQSLRGLMAKHSDHISQETIKKAMDSLDKSLAYIEYAQRPTPRFAKLTNKFFNPVSFDKQKRKFNDVKSDLDQLVRHLENKGVIEWDEANQYTSLLNNVSSTLNSSNAKDWFSPNKLKKRMNDLMNHQQTLNSIIQQFEREHAEVGMEQAISALPINLSADDSERSVGLLHQNFAKFVHRLKASQTPQDKLLAQGGSLVGFITMTNIIGPMLAKGVNSLLAKLAQVGQVNRFAYGHGSGGSVPNGLNPAIQEQVNHVTPAGAFALNDSLGGEPWNYRPVPY